MTKTPSKANKRTAAQLDADAVFIEHYAVMGKTEWQITALLNIERAKCDPPYQLSRSQIKQDLTRIRAEWHKEMTKDISEFVEAELKGLQRQEDELWLAWERTKKNAVTKTTETLPEKRETVAGIEIKRKLKGKTVIKSEGQNGQAAYMDLIFKCRDQRRSLLGLDQPKRTEITGADGGAIIVAQAQFDPAAVRGPAPEKKP
jgi:hypothetical protein